MASASSFSARRLAINFRQPDVSALFAPPTGGLWVGYRFGGFSFLKNGKLTNFVEFPSRTGTVNGFAQDRNGIVWAATNTGVWRFDRSSWQQNPAEWNPELRLVAQVGFDREGILWVLTDNRSLEVERQLFYLMPDGRKFRNAGSHLLVQGFTWDADLTVLTSHEKRPREPGSGVELESSLPAYPILKNNSEQILDRAKGIWFLPVDPIVLVILRLSRWQKSSARPREAILRSTTSIRTALQGWLIVRAAYGLEIPVVFTVSLIVPSWSRHSPKRN